MPGQNRRPVFVLLLVAVLIVGCGSPDLSPSAVPSASAPATPNESIAVLGPSATPSLVPPSTPAPSTSPPRPTSSPGATALLPGSTPTLDVLPMRAGLVSMAPGLDGGLYVLVADTSGTGDRSVVTLLDRQGRPQAGWPIALEGWSLCGKQGWYAAADGSVRLVCYAGEPWQIRAFAFDPRGRPLDGWPVELPAQGLKSGLSVVGDSLLVMAREQEWDNAADQFAGAWWLISVARDGTLQVGARYEVPDAGDYGFPELGPNGIAYQLALLDNKTKIRTLDLDSDGRASPVAVGTVPIAAMSNWSGAGPGQPAVVVAPDGTAYFLSDAGGQTTVFALDSSGRPMTGWPYRASAGLQWQEHCPADTTGCGEVLAIPAVGPDGVLYLPQEAHRAMTGGSLVAIGRDGRVRPGWPVVLGAEVWSVVVSADGTAYALAIEPEAGGESSATIVAIDPDGSVGYRTTVVDP
jgi:hypothetical protein